MRTKSILSMLVLSAVVMTFGINEARAAVSMQVGTPNMSFSISDYQPAPANVYVHNDQGRPYYVERDRRVYMERRKLANIIKTIKNIMRTVAVMKAMTDTRGTGTAARLAAL